MIIKVDVPELERLAEIITAATAKAGDLLARTKDVKETLEADPEFCNIPGAVNTVAILESSIVSFDRIHNSLRVMKRTLKTAPGEFMATEASIVSSIEQLTVKLDLLAAKMDSVMRGTTEEKGDAKDV